MDFINELNENQREAVVNTEGPTLVIAGAGSGKTRVLTYRIAHLLSKGIPAYRILALTFTNKAAREMQKRIATLVGQSNASNLWMGTFHSIFSKILRVEAEHLGYSSNFTIYDSQDSKNLIKSIVKDLRLDEKVYKPNDVPVSYTHLDVYKRQMFGYACNETDNYMPLSLELSHLLLFELAQIRKEGQEMTYLRPDSKSQVTIEYGDDNKPARVHTIVISTQHDEFVRAKEESPEAQLEADAQMVDQIRWDIINILLPRVKRQLPARIQALFDEDLILQMCIRDRYSSP